MRPGGVAERLVQKVLERVGLTIYTARVSDCRPYLPGLALTLTKAELARARSYRLNRDREAFIVRRAIIRALLGRRLGIRASGVAFRCGWYGKPELALGASEAGISFNVSSCGEDAVFGLSEAGEIGVDIEYERSFSPLDDVAASVMDEVEFSEFAALPAHSGQTRFIRAWTVKEAYLKAIGVGLCVDPRLVGISLSGSVQVARVPAGLRPVLEDRVVSRRVARGWIAAVLLDRATVPPVPAVREEPIA